jgi:hypothetical protein
VFFQGVLFLGYLYAHLSIRAGGRKVVLVHCALLAVAVLALPIYPDVAWKPHSGEGAVLSILSRKGGQTWKTKVFISYLAGLFRKRGDGQPPA